MSTGEKLQTRKIFVELMLLLQTTNNCVCECVCVWGCVCAPSGEVIVEESGVPVQDDWSMAPDEDKVKFSLSGVTPL